MFLLYDTLWLFSTGQTPLHYAAANDDYNMVDLLLRRGANPDIMDKYKVLFIF